MNKIIAAFFCAVVMMVFDGCILNTNAFDSKQSVTGVICGMVVDSEQRPVSGAVVRGVYVRKWTTIPVMPSELVVGTAITDTNGRFTLKTAKRVDKFHVHTKDFSSWGELNVVSQSQNIIQLRGK